MLQIKQGVKLKGLSTRMCVALQVAEGAYGDFGYPLTLAHALDGVHAVQSFHYQGDAVDLRTKGIANLVVHGIVASLKLRLPGFDIILEDEGGDNEHLHIEPAGERPA